MAFTIATKLVIGLAAQLGWAALGLYLYRHLHRPGGTPEHMIRINRVMGALLAASALTMLV
ncbi:hypothetical protein [Swaminathania salitolerans]|uniref:Uncharacterized protein n=1 Tax=Swaminathania salitolerans TaxID=182838 RepID=A0A511BQG7_9PROT|nr:hypothetical protein [Swaminathania salitolerans]GBQ13472.1 hypothetical protein AA21291_1512 [Swaminathania salitolerans LMG 21291]GEL02312.1 hypothetical protein SSA02_14750 [Swaminathania salitolerans]